MINRSVRRHSSPNQQTTGSALYREAFEGRQTRQVLRVVFGMNLEVSVFTVVVLGDGADLGPVNRIAAGTGEDLDTCTSTLRSK